MKWLVLLGKLFVFTFFRLLKAIGVRVSKICKKLQKQ